jgi:hypothetical protein
MFRTIIVRNEQLLQQTARQINKLNAVRCLSTQCLKKIQISRYLTVCLVHVDKA